MIFPLIQLSALDGTTIVFYVGFYHWKSLAIPYNWIGKVLMECVNCLIIHTIK